MPAVQISADDARRLLLGAQGLVGAEARRGGVPAMLARLGAVQLDTISTLARSHELVAYARLGAVGRTRVQRAYWPTRGPATSFEYWSHAACVLPISLWPYFAFRRRAYRARGRRWHQSTGEACRRVLAQLRSEGPLSVTALGGARTAAPGWWSWSDTKIAAEWLLDIGEVVCVRREGWKRIYDLPERVLPGALLAAEPGDGACITHLVGVAARALGVATRSDLVDFHRLLPGHAAPADVAARIDAAIEAAGLVPVRVHGWTGRSADAWADPATLATVVRGHHATTLLSPFDSLVWDRKRTARVFDFDHRLEAYVPAARRVHGYFTMPLLAGGRLIGRVDPTRQGTTLVARQASLDVAPGSARAGAAVAALCQALWSAAGWVGCDDVRVGKVTPPELAGAIRQELPRRAAGIG